MLDASHSARPHHRRILELTQHILGQLPGSVGRQLYFLGNQQAYDPAQLCTRSSQWIGENLGRASLLGPVMRRLDPSAPTKIVVLGAGRIFDLDDWVEHPLFARLALVACGEPLQPAGGSAREIACTDQGNVVGFLYDPIVRVSVTSPGFMPLWWDNAGYVCEMGDGGARLTAADVKEQRLLLRFLASRPEQLRASVLTASGSQVELALQAAAPRRPQSRVLGHLSDDEARLFHQACERRPYECPHCHDRHDWQELYCTRGRGIFGKPIYEDLPDDSAGFVIFRETPAGVEVGTCCEQVLLLDAATVAVGRGGEALLYRFDPRREMWQPDERARFQQYTRIEEHAYVVFL